MPTLKSEKIVFRVSEKQNYEEGPTYPQTLYDATIETMQVD
jgi:hypothetical protein